MRLFEIEAEDQEVPIHSDERWKQAEAGGLPMDTKSRMARAKAMGFSTRVFHATTGEFDKFNIDFKETDAILGTHVGTKSSANDRLDWMMGPSDHDWDSNASILGKTAQIMPLLISVQNPLRLPDLGYWRPGKVAEALRTRGINVAGEGTRESDQLLSNQDLRDAIVVAGYDSVVYKNNVEGMGTDSYILFSPSQLRSVHAVFDPSKASSGNLLEDYLR